MDIVVAILYLAHIIGLIATSVIVLVKRDRPNVHAQDVQFEWFGASISIICFAAGLIGPIFALLAYVNVLIFILLISFLGLGACGGTLYVVWKHVYVETSLKIGLSVLPGLIIIFVGLLLFLSTKTDVRNRWIQAYQALAILILERPATLLLSGVISLVWSVALVYGFYLLHSISIRCTGGERVALFVFVLLSTIWNERLITYIGYTTYCGTFASWYIVNGSADADRMPRATLKAFLRSVTVSLGSLALASLLLAATFILSGVLKAFFGKCGGKCGKKAVEKISDYVNDYALVYIATGGHSLIAASKLAKQSCKHKSAIADSMMGLGLITGLSFGAVCACTTLCLIQFVYIAKTFNSSPLLYIFMSPVITFLSWFAIRTALAPFHSAQISLEACHAESPDMLKIASPAIYALVGKRIEAANQSKAEKTAAKTAKKTAPAAAKKTATAKAGAAKTAKKTTTVAKTTTATTATVAKTTTATKQTASTNASSSAPSTMDP